MKVLITVPRLDLPGGVANYYAELRRYLDRDKVYLEIGTRDLESGLFRNVMRLFNDWLRFHRTLKESEFDLVLVNPSLGSKAVIRDGVILMIASWHGLPSIVFFRGWNPQFEAKLRSSYAGLFRRVFGKAKAFILLGSIFKEKIRTFGFFQPVFLETTLVDDSIFQLASISRRVSSVTNILLLSRLDYDKGIIESIHAFGQVKQDFPQLSMTIAGDGPVRQEAEKLVKDLGIPDVRFLGHITGQEKIDAFRAADVYLLTSLHEGMPNSVLEAMAFGLPIITSPVGGLTDFFESGRMGLIVDPLSPADIAQGLAKLIADPEACARISAFNHEYAQKRFAASLVAKRLQSICRSVIDQ